MSSKNFNYGKDKLTYKIAIKIAKNKLDTALSSDQSDKISQSRKNVESVANSNKTVYGLSLIHI